MRDDGVLAASDEPTTGSAEFTEGRYLYCVVELSQTSEDASLDDRSVRGIEDEPVYAIEADGFAAIVHACDGLYDSDDPTTVREWLLNHQSVVDAVGERYGTPLPFRFDTIVTGDDEAVREWLRDTREDLVDFFESFAGCWEYRVEVVRIDAPEFEDERLAELREEADAASEGRAFLVEKQLDDRRRELRRAADDAIATDARERLEPLTRELDVAVEPDGVATFSLLAHEDDETAIGEELDAVAEMEGIEVRFTGPWPPYSFAPEL